MHRDIKPGNMGIRSFEPLEAVIFDFGHATFENTSNDHFKGTIAYLAPEVLALKYSGVRSRYGRAVDVWAMGLSGYQLIYRRHWGGFANNWGAEISHFLRETGAVSEELYNATQSPLTGVLQRMLAKEPESRIPASDALGILSSSKNEWKYHDKPDILKRPREEEDK